MVERGKSGDQVRADSCNIIRDFISTFGLIRNIFVFNLSKSTFLVIVLYPLIITFYTEKKAK